MQKQSPAKKADVYWIEDEAQMRCLISSMRQSIGDYLTGFGPQPIREIATALGCKPSALYYHVEELLKVGLVLEVGTQQLNKKIEKLYDTPAKSMRWGMSLLEPKNGELWQQVIASQCRQSHRDFKRGLDSKHALEDGELRNLRSFRLIGSPNKKTRAQINQKIEEIAKLMMRPSSQSTESEDLLTVSWVMAPLRED